MKHIQTFDELSENTTDAYAVPTMAVKPYPGDTGYEVVRQGYQRSKYSSVDLAKAKTVRKLDGTVDPSPDQSKVLEAETGAYPVPTTARKIQKGDKGYALTKKAFKEGEKTSRKQAPRKKMKKFAEFFESELFESQQFFYEDELDKDSVEVKNVPGVDEPTATVKWSLELNQNKAGIEAFVVKVKELKVKWGADEDLGQAGEAEVKPEKIKSTVEGSLANLYCESVEFDNQSGEAVVRFGRNKDEDE